MDRSENLGVELVGKIRECADSLPQKAVGTNSKLRIYADRIEAPASPEDALKQFHKYAPPWKGLRDLTVPGCEKEWTRRVKYLAEAFVVALKANNPERTR